MAQRIKPETLEPVSRVLVKGTEAQRLPEPTTEGYTHDWKVYVRGPRDSDISDWVRQVVFLLHPSFAVAERAITAPPFEVSEMGWGDFDIQIAIYFHDSRIPPFRTSIHLQLNPFGRSKERSPLDPVYNEFYETVTFTEYSQEFGNRLRRNPQPPSLPTLRAWALQGDTTEDSLIETLSTAEAEVKARLKEALARYKGTASYAARLRTEISNLEKQEGRRFDTSEFRTFTQ